MLFCFLQSFPGAETTILIDLYGYLFTLNAPECKLHVGRDHVSRFLLWMLLCPQQLLHQLLWGSLPL